MENTAGNIQKDIAETAASYNRKRKRWQVLLVKGDGRILTFGLFRSLWVVLLMVIAVPGAAALVLGLFFQYGFFDKSNLQRDIGELRQQNHALRNQVDVLTAKLVLMESRNDEKVGAKSAKTNGNPLPPSNAKVPVAGAGGKTDPEPAETEAGWDKTVEKKDSGIEIKDLAAEYESDGGIFRVRFVIQENDAVQASLAGHCFVILKGKDNDPGQWLTLPETTLVNGKPDAPEKGQSFKISRYKSVALKVKAHKKPEQFTNAAVILFNQEGRIIHEQDIPISISIKRHR